MTIELPYPYSDNKLFDKKVKQYCIIPIEARPILSLAFGKRDRGGQGLGKQHRIKSIFIDNENRAFAEFTHVDKSGTCYKYAPIGRLQQRQRQRQRLPNGKEADF